jgi:hypothetical protein
VYFDITSCLPQKQKGVSHPALDAIVARRLEEKPNLLGFHHHMEKLMTERTFLWAALIAVAIFTSQAAAGAP